MQEMVAWKARRKRKPLLLYGARQTGKSWLMAEFGRACYPKVAAIDLSDNERMRALFSGDYDIGRIVGGIGIETGLAVTPGDTLIIIDEIQEEPRAVTALKYFYEKAPDYHVVAAGSLMGVALHKGTSFPVGKVDSLTLHPLDFPEYLAARGQELLADAVLQGRMGDIEPVFSKKLTGLLREYLFVGGMPEVVAEFAQHHDLTEARRIQQSILSDYDRDFSKHAPLRMLERMRLVWSSVPSQLAKENRKFLYGTVRPGARARDFEEAIQWLTDYGALRKVNRVAAIRSPLTAYEELAHFKLFALDVGLTSALAHLDARAVLEGSTLFTEFRGALTEQYVEQQLESAGLRPCYWSSESNAEIDLLVEVQGQPLPIEVKAGENLRAKSLKVAHQRFGLEKSVRTSLSPYRDEGWLTNIPLWAIRGIRPLLSLPQP
jgi:predicted AAA+ superfamily ATPase